MIRTARKKMMSTDREDPDS